MLNKLTDRIYYMPESQETDRPLLGLVIGEDSSLVVDAGTSPKHAREFLEAVAELNVSPLKYLTITHWHWDHIFGIHEMNLTTIVHTLTKKKIKELQALAWDNSAMQEYVKEGWLSQFCRECLITEMPSVEERKIGDYHLSIENRLEINLGNLTCIIENIGGPHSDDSVLIYIPEEKVMFLGDCVYGRFYSGVYGYTLDSVREMVQKINQYPADYYLISHEKPFTKRKMDDFFNQLLAIGELAENESNRECVLMKYEELFGKNTDEDVIFFIDCYVNVNKVREHQKG